MRGRRDARPGGVVGVRRRVAAQSALAIAAAATGVALAVLYVALGPTNFGICAGIVGVLWLAGEAW